MICEALREETTHSDAEVRKQIAYLLGRVSAQIMSPSEIELPAEIIKELMKRETEPQVREVMQKSLQKLSARKIFRL